MVSRVRLVKQANALDELSHRRFVLVLVSREFFDIQYEVFGLHI